MAQRDKWIQRFLTLFNIRISNSADSLYQKKVIQLTAKDQTKYLGPILHNIKLHAQIRRP